MIGSEIGELAIPLFALRRFGYGLTNAQAVTVSQLATPPDMRGWVDAA